MKISEFSSIALELSKIMKAHKGIEKHVALHKQFEGWMQVELVRLLEESGLINSLQVEYNVSKSIEENYVDVYFKSDNESWAVELKVLKTNSITANDSMQFTPTNLTWVINDGIRLNETDIQMKVLLFFVYPTCDQNTYWQKRLKDLNHGYKLHGKYPIKWHDIDIEGILYLYVN